MDEQQEKTREILAARVCAATHAMQSGVAAKMPYVPSETEPKHLRVGVNSAMVEHQALAELLMAKGVITSEEYLETCARCMEAEVLRYEEWLSERLGTTVALK